MKMFCKIWEYLVIDLDEKLINFCSKVGKILLKIQKHYAAELVKFCRKFGKIAQSI